MRSGSDSPAVQLMSHLWGKSQESTGHSWLRLNQGLRQDHFQPMDGVCMKLRTPMDMCPCTSYVAPSSEVTAAQANYMRLVGPLRCIRCDWVSEIDGMEAMDAKLHKHLDSAHPGWLLEKGLLPLAPLGGDSAEASGRLVIQCIEHDCEDCPICAEERGSTTEPVEGKGFEEWLHSDDGGVDYPLQGTAEGTEARMRAAWIAAQAALSAPRAQAEGIPALDVTDGDRIAVLRKCSDGRRKTIDSLIEEVVVRERQLRESRAALVAALAGQEELRSAHADAQDCILRVQALYEASERALAALRGERDTPETEDFFKGVPLEAAHQRSRWGTSNDGGKEPADWFWLVGYLAGKCLASHISGNRDKALHHTISTAAALANWHMAIKGKGDMRPGIEPPAPTEDRK